MKKIKLLYMINSLTIGGAECLLWDVVNSLDMSLFDINVLYLYDNNEFIFRPEVKIQCMGFNQNDIYKNLFYLIRMLKYLKRDRYDIIHTHLSNADFYGQITRPFCAVPLLYTTIHNNVEWPSEVRTKTTIIEDILIRQPDRILTVSETLNSYVNNKKELPVK